MINKPIKICIENDSKISTEYYKSILKEVLQDILKWNYELRNKLTRQQIHSEKGKIKHGNYQEVINFLTNRGFSKEYINNEVDKVRERIILNKELSVPISMINTTKFGIINLKE